MTVKEAIEKLASMKIQYAALRSDGDRAWDRGDKHGSTGFHNDAYLINLKIQAIENAFVMVPIP